MNNLRSGSGKSREREIAVLRHGREWLGMKMNAYRDDFAGSMLPYSASEAKAPADTDRGTSNPILVRDDSASGTVGASVRRPFPLRTLMVCFTIWLIATQAMIFDQVKFVERAQLLEQTARSLGAPQLVVPSERPSHASSGAEMQRL
jgi:hypothetical protein